MLRGSGCAQLAGTVLVEMQRHPDGRSDSEELPMLPSLARRWALPGDVLAVLARCQPCHRRQSRCITGSGMELELPHSREV